MRAQRTGHPSVAHVSADGGVPPRASSDRWAARSPTPNRLTDARCGTPPSALATAVLLTLAACDAGRAPPLFELLPPERTGVTFVNEVPADTAFNIINYLNYYNGGGVAVGDVDGDGLPDLYLTANRGPNRLYRNLGDFRFEDVTERAGVAGSAGWTSGVTMADVNGDGHLDLYVSAVEYRVMRGRNILYINDGDGTFTDRTEEYGLAHRGYSTQAAFFDYDLDGDLDMYLLNHSVHSERTSSPSPQREPRNPRAGDRLFRNDGERFVDVSDEAGIYGGPEGYGLGVVVSDLNMDGCPDVFVANDFHETDFLYFNNCDGTFRESIARAMPHTSRSSMGVDAADFNNDGRPDVIVLDMLPEREDIYKTSVNAESRELFAMKLEAGYHPQYARNTLHLNRGRGRFSEIAYLAGVYATDWSWAPLFADLDNDGHKDLFVTNGIYHRPNDLDFLAYVGTDSVQGALGDPMTEANLRLLDSMPHVPIPNYAYRNNGDLTFTNVAAAWGLAQPGFSTGAAYADLDGDGALDLVVNNINAPAAIYRSRARESGNRHYLAVRLRGAGANVHGIGAKVVAKHGGTSQLLEQMPTRGFQSSVDLRLHFGLGSSVQVDTLRVIWPDGSFQTLTDVAADQVVTLAQEDADGDFDYASWHGGHGGHREPPLFEDLTSQSGIDLEHDENPFFDYTREPSMPHQLSTEGPALAAGDVNGDGLDDVYVGGAKWQAGRLFVQQRDGTFRAASVPAFETDSLHEDVDAALFDADGDGDQDLYVVSGGNEWWGEAEALRDRLYLNDGRGGFRRAAGALPDFFENGSCVIPGDYDGDGDVDLFVGSRVVARAYGITPRSRLLENDGAGRFTDVTIERAEALSRAGMVTDAAWVDYDADGALDLIVVGEWMPVSVFRQEDERFVDHTADAGVSATAGWWNVVASYDLDGDGDQDLVLGNLGLNSYIRASPTEPTRLYVHDFSGDGRVEQILTVHRNGERYPVAGRDLFLEVMPSLRSRFPSYDAFGASTIEDVLPRADLRRAIVREASTFASAVGWNDGRGRFRVVPLPIEAQFAPIYAALGDDFDADGNVDLVVAGNFYGVTPVRGRYDASYGLVLRGTGEGAFESVGLATSNLVIEGEVRDLKFVRRANGDRVIVVAKNDAAPQVLRPLRLRKP